MYCINCGKQIADNANFCIYCGSPVVTQIPTVLAGAASEAPPAAVPVAPLRYANEPIEYPSAEPITPVATLPSISVPPFIDRSSMNRQASIDAFALLVLGAAVLVVVAFFLPWFRVSSPIANVLFPGLVYDVSGFKLFIGFPEVGQPGSPVVFAIPLLAIVAVFSSFLAGNAGSFGLVSRVVAVASALAGIALIVLLYLGMQTVWNNELSRLGMFGLLVSRVVKIDLSLGFWLALLGFALIVPLSALRSNRHSRD